MAPPRSLPLVAVLLAAALPLLFVHPTDAGTVGINWGRVANDLPKPADVVQLLKQQGITQVKLYDADPTVLRALANTGIKVVVALPNEQLVAAATRPSFALAWVRRNVAAYYPATQIQTVAVGNEVFATAKSATLQLVPAMNNVHGALARLGIDGAVKVSSPIALVALASSYPPSAGAFKEDLGAPVMKPMLDFLARTGSPLMVNAYPFFAYSGNADVVSLDYALFRPNAGVLDPATGLKYYSLLDAQLDAVFAAVSKLGGDYSGVKVVVSETGWPSKGDANEPGAGAANAAAYNGNLVRRVLSGNAGTPRRPDADIDVFLFALFNENQKPGPTSERNYGVFYPNQQKVYDVEFILGGGRGGPNSARGGGLGWQENGGPNSPISGSTSAPSSGGGVKATTTGEAWCVANAMAGQERLQAALDFACGPGGADCKGIQPGAACYEPNTMVAHASYAFNDYFQRKGRSIGTCYFGGAAYVVNQAPKMGKCDLPSTV